MSLFRPSLKLLLALLLALPFAAMASTSNLEREKNWAEQIGDFLVIGEAIRLEAAGVKFLALYTKPAKASTRGVILLHGRGVHPAWGFIDSLRGDLAENGWHTLSLQMPILDPEVAMTRYGETFPEAFKRIHAGMHYLKQLGIKHVVIVGHSTGAMTAAAYIVEYPDTALAGAVLIGYSNEPKGSVYMQGAKMIEKLHLPTLDIYGSEDLPTVRHTAQARRDAAKRAGNADYRQVRVSGASHFFTDRYPNLYSQLRHWLTNLPLK